MMVTKCRGAFCACLIVEVVVWSNKGHSVASGCECHMVKGGRSR